MRLVSMTIQKLQTEDPEAFKLLCIFGMSYSRTICTKPLSNRMAIHKNKTITSWIFNDQMQQKCVWSGWSHYWILDHSLTLPTGCYLHSGLSKMITETVQLCIERISFKKKTHIIKIDWEYVNKGSVQLVYLWIQPLLKSHIKEVFGKFFLI